MSTKDSDQANQEFVKVTASKETQSRPKPPSSTPQERIDSVWTNFTAKRHGKVTQILQHNSQAVSKAKQELERLGSARRFRDSYNDAKKKCIANVNKIIEECKRCNIRFRDQHFDIEFDLKNNHGADCLYPLSYRREDKDRGKAPRSVKRVHQIFNSPQFYEQGATPPDIRQGTGSHCWVLAALGSLGGAEKIEDICVARDENVGVYGFVFHRDGAWDYTIIDDKLYLIHADFHESVIEKQEWSRLQFRKDPEEEYRKAYQEGSRALYFASCSQENETWLPLLEKAFAKAHGDYSSLDYGYTGEATEDLTGGVTTELRTSDILDTEKCWEELQQINTKFLFGCSTGRLDDWQLLDKWQRLERWQRLGNWQDSNNSDRKGIQRVHAYTIIGAREVEIEGKKPERLVLLRNPWGKTEWTGRWGDGSSEWTDKMRELLNHVSADDGIFWMPYSDWLKKFDFLDRTRLFDDSWWITQHWTSLQVPWSGVDFHETKFTFTLGKESPVVVVLSQLDERYWRGLQGQYSFTLHFRINEEGKNDCLAYSHGNYSMRRSVNVELAKLSAGTYDIHIKVTAFRDKSLPTIDKVLMKHFEHGRTKLMKMAFSYDMAHARGLVLNNEEEKKHRAENMDKNSNTEDLSVIKSFKRKELEIEQKLQEPKKRKVTPRKAHHGPRSVQETKDIGGGLVPQFPTVTPPSEDGERVLRHQNKGKSSTPEPPHIHATPGTITESSHSWTSYVDPAVNRDPFKSKHDHIHTDIKYHEYSAEVIDEDIAELTTDPWNAVCMVGLRIFSMTNETEIVVKSAKPVPDGEGTVDIPQPETSEHAFSSYGEYTHDDDDGAPVHAQAHAQVHAQALAQALAQDPGSGAGRFSGGAIDRVLNW